MYVNLIDKHKKDGWKTCFPIKKSVARIDRESFIDDQSKEINYCIYTNFKKIFNFKLYGIVTWIPPHIIEQIKKDKLKEEFIGDCFYF